MNLEDIGQFTVEAVHFGDLLCYGVLSHARCYCSHCGLVAHGLTRQ
jgi:hypothetical protein